MCGRFALGLDGDDLPEQVMQQYLRAQRRREDPETFTDSVVTDPNTTTGTGTDTTGGTGNQAEESGETNQATATEDTNMQIEWDPRFKGWYKPRYNIAPMSWSVVLRQSGSKLILSTMKWGLIPSFYKQPPDKPLKTINCRDDKLFSGSGLWASLRDTNRCIVIGQGFFEWQNKGKSKVAHFTRMNEGELMLMAGLWDSVLYAGESTPIESFTIITTSSNKQLAFLHDRMPAILNDAASVLAWLDPSIRWNKYIQGLIVPFPIENGLRCYPVTPDVGSISKDRKDFIEPISEKKGTISSLFKKQDALNKVNSLPATMEDTPKPKRSRSPSLEIVSFTTPKKPTTTQVKKPKLFPLFSKR